MNFVLAFDVEDKIIFFLFLTLCKGDGTYISNHVITQYFKFVD